MEYQFVMKKLLLPLLFFSLFSCLDDDVKYHESWQKVAVDAHGREYQGRNPNTIRCGRGWARKQCRFLNKYEGTIWTDKENYNSDYSDIEFSNFTGSEFFITYFSIDDIPSSCERWKLGETYSDGEKWDIELKKDEVDVLWVQYDYYGLSEEIQYSTMYKYEVIDGLLHFSIGEDQTFIFHPSESNYTIDC